MNMLRDTPGSGSPEDRRVIWELIPWYVTGTLCETEAKRVETYARSNPDCAREIARQRALAEDLQNAALSDTPDDTAQARSWEALRAEVEADIAARTPAATKAEKRWLARFGGRFAVIGGAVALASAALVAVLPLTGPGGGDFVTLTSDPDAGAVGQIIRFQPAGPLSLPELTALGVIQITGPSESGVYSAVVSAQADTADIARAMMAREDILFAAPEGAE